jgi:hypothetical protein
LRNKWNYLKRGRIPVRRLLGSLEWGHGGGAPKGAEVGKAKTDEFHSLMGVEMGGVEDSVVGVGEEVVHEGAMDLGRIYDDELSEGA